MKPRAGHTQGEIRETCKNVALALKRHRGTNSGHCNVCDFRLVQGERIGCPSGVSSVTRAQHLGMMRSHDEACSCRCFHIDSNRKATADDSSETAQLHTGTARQVVHQELEVPESVVDPAWESAPGRRSRCEDYWTRAVKNGDDIWHQYGISERPSDGRPDFFFTCKMKPRVGRNEQPIRDNCKYIACMTRQHRSSRYNRCTCSFQTWRKSEGSGGCRVRWYDLNARMSKYCMNAFMNQHDRLCSCGCFDVETGKDAATSSQHLRD